MSTSVPFSLLDIITGCIFALVIINVSFFALHRRPDKSIILRAILVKLIVSVLFGLYSFTYWRDGDTMSYHSAGVGGSQFIRDNLLHTSGQQSYPFAFLSFEGSSTTRMQSLSGLIHLFTFDSFLASSFIFALIALLGQLLIYGAFVTEYPDPRIRRWWQMGILFLPSLSFWTGGLLKDPIGILGLGLVITGFQGARNGRYLRAALSISLGFYTLILFRPQVAPILLLALIPWLLQSRPANASLSRSGGQGSLLQPGRVLIVLLALIAAASTWKGVSSAARQLPVDLAQQRAVSQSLGGSVDTDKMITSASWTSLVSAWPEATFFTLYRPLLWEGLKSPPLFFASIENLALLLLSLRTIGRLYANPALRQQTLLSPLFLSSFIFVALFTLGLGVSNPNMGNISRYRLPVMPFLTAMLAIAQYHWLKRKGASTQSSTVSQPRGWTHQPDGETSLNAPTLGVGEV